MQMRQAQIEGKSYYKEVIKMEWIEKILQTGNITDACYEVIRNKGSAGVNMMNVNECQKGKAKTHKA